MRAKSIHIEDGPPAIYRLPMREVMRNDRQHIAKCHISKPLPKDRSPEKVIMVLGATGAGKTTMINSIANYILGVQWEDEFRFKLVMEAERGIKSQAHSQTQWITAYSFHKMEGSTIPYTLTIVDTPGFGDTEGLGRDKTIASQIKEFFSLPGEDGIDHLDAVCFVTQASLARLTTTQQYIFDSILSTFGKDIASNIFMMITFADGNKPPVVDAIKHANIPFSDYFKFNNVSPFSEDDECSDDEDSDSDEDEDSDQDENFSKMFWTMTFKSLQNFFTTFTTVEPRSLQLTREVLEERQQLETIIQGLQQKISIGLSKIDELQQEECILKQREADILANKEFTYEVKVSKSHKIDISGSGHFVTNCLKCNFTCHYPCPYPSDEDKYRCAVMINRGDPNDAKCSICPGRCPWRMHVNTPCQFEMYEQVEKRTSDDLKRRYYVALSKQSSVKGVIATMKDDLVFLQRKVIEMSREAKESMQRLDEIALKPSVLSEAEYIDLLIESEKQEAKSGFQQRIKYYQDMKKKALIMSKLTDTSDVTVGAIKHSTDRWEDFKFW